METRTLTNETYDSAGKLIRREVVKITTDEFGNFIEEILSVEEF